MTETSPNSLRNDALGLDLRVQRKLFETSPVQTLKKKRNFGEMMTTHRYEDILEPNYTPRTKKVKENQCIFLRETESAPRRELIWIYDPQTWSSAHLRNQRKKR